jgi:hypothetical protein
MQRGKAMSTAIRTVLRMSSAASRQNQVLEELRREHHEKLEAWVRGLCVSLNPTDAVGVNEIESLSDDCSGAGIGAAILEITDSTEPIVHSICGRDRRLRIR